MKASIIIWGLIISLFGSYELKAQRTQGDTTWLLMTKKNTPSKFRTIQPGRPLKYTDLRKRFGGIPTDLDTFQVYAVDFQPPQRVFQAFKNGEMDSTEYRNYVKRYQIEEKKLSPTAIKQQVYVLSGLRKSQKIIICDANNDGNFADEEVRQVSVTEKDKKYVIDSLKGTYVHYEYCLNKQVRPLRTLLKIVPYDKSYTFKDSLQQKLSIFFSVTEYSSASVIVNGEQYEIRLPFPQSIAGNNYSKADVFVFDAQGNVLPIKPYLKMGDVYKFQGQLPIKFDMVTELGDSLRIIRYTADEQSLGFRVGERVETLAFRDIAGAAAGPHKEKRYTVLDFWGTWCGPCVAGLPKLKAFYDTYQDRVTLISVAYDRDSEKVKQFINNKQMRWLHKFESQEAPQDSDWVKTLRVECFPTFVLIDNQTNKILLRECGEDKLKILADFLESQ